MQLTMIHPRLWLLACVWCLMAWTAPAQASWEAYQRAGEDAYNRGHYDEAEQMFLAAVREARHFGPQDPRLDISLNKLELLRRTRGQHARDEVRSQPATRQKDITRQRQPVRRSRQRQQPHTVRKRAKPEQRKQAVQQARPGERRQGARVSPQKRRSERPRAGVRRAQPTQRAAPPVRPRKQQKSVRQSSPRQKAQDTPLRETIRNRPRPGRPELPATPLRENIRRRPRPGRLLSPVLPAKRHKTSWAPHLPQSRQGQQLRSTTHQTRSQQPGRTLQPGITYRGTRLPRQSMLFLEQPDVLQAPAAAGGHSMMTWGFWV